MYIYIHTYIYIHVQMYIDVCAPAILFSLLTAVDIRMRGDLVAYGDDCTPLSASTCSVNHERERV